MRLVLMWLLFFGYVALVAYFFIQYDASREPLSQVSEPIENNTGTISKPDSLLALVYNAYDNQDYETARSVALLILESYPNSLHAERARALLAALNNEKPVAVKTPQPQTPAQAAPKKPLPTARSKPRAKPPAVPSPAVAGTPSQPSGEEPQNPMTAREEEVLSFLRREFDSTQRVSYYFNRNISHYVYKNSCELYIGQASDGDTWLRLRVYYTGEQPLKINAFAFYADDREYPIPTLYGNMERGKGSGGAWEWFDMQVTPAEMQTMLAIARSQRTAIKYIGEEGTYQRALSEGEKLRMSRILEAYEILSRRSDVPAAVSTLTR